MQLESSLVLCAEAAQRLLRPRAKSSKIPCELNWGWHSSTEALLNISITAKHHGKSLIYKSPALCHRHWRGHMDKHEQTAGSSNLRDWYCDMLCVLLGQLVCCYLLQRQNSCLICQCFGASKLMPVFWFTLPLFFLPPSQHMPDLHAFYANLILTVTDIVRLTITLTPVQQDICTDA